MQKVMFVFWCLVGIFIIVPITNIVVLNWTSANGTLAQTFNASDLSSWNATGKILTAEQAAQIPLNPLENTVTQLYVPVMMIFLGIIVIYVISRWNQNSRGGGG